MSKNRNATGMSFSSWLTLIFIVLKLTNVIGWSWLWVLSPTWIPLAMVIVILLFVGLFTLIKTIKRSYKARKEVI